MRMLLPPVRERRRIDRLLAGFFHEHRLGDFRQALTRIAHYYRLPTPRITWFEYLDWGKTAGRTYENGEIHLVHPENWKRGRKYNSERQWVSMIYHEMGHYILWTDAERKADTFAMRMVRGLGADRARTRSALALVDGIGADRIGETALRARRRPSRRSKTRQPRRPRG
jgi:hypothetical protein